MRLKKNQKKATNSGEPVQRNDKTKEKKKKKKKK